MLAEFFFENLGFFMENFEVYFSKAANCDGERSISSSDAPPGMYILLCLEND